MIYVQNCPTSAPPFFPTFLPFGSADGDDIATVAYVRWASLVIGIRVSGTAFTSSRFWTKRKLIMAFLLGGVFAGFLFFLASAAHTSGPGDIG